MVLEMFKSDRFQDVSLNQWMALTPTELVRSNLQVGPELGGSQKRKMAGCKISWFSYYPK